MIDQLDKTLENLLKRELSQDLVSQVKISFATPDDAFLKELDQSKAIDLFLYDIRENRELRTNEWHVERKAGNMATKKRAPVRVDCSYLVTAWGKDPPDEHHLLREVMVVLLRHPILPREVLHDGLKVQDPAMPAATLQPGRLQSMGEFWQALGGKPKAALHYTVTVIVDPFEDGGDFRVPVVTEKTIKIRQVHEKGGTSSSE